MKRSFLQMTPWWNYNSDARITVKSIPNGLRLATDQSRFLTTALLVSVISLTGISNSVVQRIERTYSEEIVVPSDIHVITNVPTSLDIQIDASKAERNNTLETYSVSGKSDKERLRVHKNFEIDTWNQNKVRQEVHLVVDAKNTEIAEALLDDLAIQLRQEAGGHLVIDANMNLSGFVLKNGRIKNDHSYVILDSGKKYDVSFIQIKTMLYIPSSASLTVQGNLNHTLILGDLEGDLVLDLQFGEVYGGRINNLYADLSSCYNVIFNQANNVHVNASNSHVKVGQTEMLTVGKDIELPNTIGAVHEKLRSNANSSMNILDFREVSEVEIHHSSNDEFLLGEITSLKAASSKFSTYRILSLLESMEFKGANGDIFISEVDGSFTMIDVENEYGELNFNIDEDSVIDLRVHNEETIEMRLPKMTKSVSDESQDISTFFIGEGNTPNATIKISCDRCELDIWE